MKNEATKPKKFYFQVDAMSRCRAVDYRGVYTGKRNGGSQLQTRRFTYTAQAASEDVAPSIPVIARLLHASVGESASVSRQRACAREPCRRAACVILCLLRAYTRLTPLLNIRFNRAWLLSVSQPGRRPTVDLDDTEDQFMTARGHVVQPGP
jgi:hypothetical protein